MPIPMIIFAVVLLVCVWYRLNIESFVQRKVHKWFGKPTAPKKKMPIAPQFPCAVLADEAKRCTDEVRKLREKQERELVASHMERFMCDVVYPAIKEATSEGRRLIVLPMRKIRLLGEPYDNISYNLMTRAIEVLNSDGYDAFFWYQDILEGSEGYDDIEDIPHLQCISGKTHNVKRDACLKCHW